MPQVSSRPRTALRIPPELAPAVQLSAAVAAIAGLGSMIVAVMPQPSAWQVAAAYLAPASLAFVAYWWVRQER